MQGLPAADPEARPHFDLVVAVFVKKGGSSPEAIDEIARIRPVYARNGGHVVANISGLASSQGKSSEAFLAAPLTFKLFLVVGREGIPGIQVPEAGILLGDIFQVDIREDKTKVMMGLSKHLRWADSELASVGNIRNCRSS